MAEMKKTSGALRFLLPALAVALVCIAVACVVVLLVGRDAPTGATQVRQINELVALSQRIPAQAAIALSGNETGFDELERAREVYSQLAEKLGPQVQGLSASVEVLKQSQAILLVREPTLTITRARSWATWSAPWDRAVWSR
jgi:twitching motility protein PilJ